ncbi:MAG: hypothetical protein ACREOS_05875 [Candidatus Dormibacteraceae bacterium]
MPNSFADVTVQLIHEEPGHTAAEYARLAYDRGLATSTARDPITSFSATLSMWITSGRETRVCRKRIDGVYRYFPTDKGSVGDPSRLGSDRLKRVPLGRPRTWETTVAAALAGLGGEATEVDILRWAQDSRPFLEFDWQQKVRGTLHDHGDGRGKALFELIRGEDEPDRWRLLAWNGAGNGRDLDADRGLSQSKNAPAWPESVRFPRRVITAALADSGTASFSAVEQYLLGVIAYELARYADAAKLFDLALANGLDGEFPLKASRLVPVHK